jgi:hypothetical protein
MSLSSRAVVFLRFDFKNISYISFRTGASFSSTTNCLSTHLYPKGACPPMGLPSFARIGTDAATLSDISSLSHCAIAAIMV